MTHRPWTGVNAGLLLNERFANLPTDHARLVYVALLLACDSYGCIEDAPRALATQLFPLLARTPDDLDAALWALADVALIDRMEGETGRWIHVRKWEQKQGGKIRRRGTTRWPAKGEPRLPDQSGTTPGPVPATPHARAAARSLSSVSGTSDSPSSGTLPREGATPPAPPSSQVAASPRRTRKPRPLWAGEIPQGLQAGDFPGLWGEWIVWRAEEQKDRDPVTQRSGDMSLKELLAWGPHRACTAIRHTMARGWKGIREPERSSQPERQSNGQPLAVFPGGVGLEDPAIVERRRKASGVVP